MWSHPRCRSHPEAPPATWGVPCSVQPLLWGVLGGERAGATPGLAEGSLLVAPAVGQLRVAGPAPARDALSCPLASLAPLPPLSPHVLACPSVRPLLASVRGAVPAVGRRSLPPEPLVSPSGTVSAWRVFRAFPDPNVTPSGRLCSVHHARGACSRPAAPRVTPSGARSGFLTP